MQWILWPEVCVTSPGGALPTFRKWLRGIENFQWFQWVICRL